MLTCPGRMVAGASSLKRRAAAALTRSAEREVVYQPSFLNRSRLAPQIMATIIGKAHNGCIEA